MARRGHTAVVNNRLRVLAKRCDECLLSSAKIVSDDRRAEILRECARTDSHFLCHKGTIEGRAIVCRGFFDARPNTLCQVAERLGLVEFVEVPGQARTSSPGSGYTGAAPGRRKAAGQ